MCGQSFWVLHLSAASCGWMTRVLLVPRDLSEVEWMFPTSVHEETLYELITATYQFSFLLLFVLCTPWPRVVTCRFLLLLFVVRHNWGGDFVDPR